MDNAIGELQQLAHLLGRMAHGGAWIAAPGQLEPLAGFLGADTASFRAFAAPGSAARPALEHTVGLAIDDSVSDAYRTRYHRWDPARRLLCLKLDQPLLSHPARDGEWRREQLAPGLMARYRREFDKYRREFLLPNGLCHHLGFCIEDAAGRKLFYDFHRSARVSAFGQLEAARAEVLALHLQGQARPQLQRPALPAAGATGRLSAREQQVALAVARGLSNKEVANDLGISTRTVENHLRAVFEKLQVNTRTRLAAAILQEGGAAAAPPSALRADPPG